MHGNGNYKQPSTAFMVSNLNRQLYANTAPEKYATFYFAMYDEAQHALTYTNAGHLSPMLVRDGKVSLLEPTGTVVGAFPFAVYEEKTVSSGTWRYAGGLYRRPGGAGKCLRRDVRRGAAAGIAGQVYARRFLRDHRARHGGGGAVDRLVGIAGRYDYGGGAAHMKVLTTAEMREVDRRTIEMGIPGIVLMENAAHRVVEFLAEHCAPLAAQRVVVLCGKGNNGGDGLAIARQLFTRFHPRALHVILLAAPEDLKGDAAANYRNARRCAAARLCREIPADARNATLVIDALLGTGVTGAASGRMLDAIREINRGFPLAKVMAVDIPSGMAGDSGEPAGEFARADYTVTFTAPKPAHVLPPNCDQRGRIGGGGDRQSGIAL